MIIVLPVTEEIFAQLLAQPSHIPMPVEMVRLQNALKTLILHKRLAGIKGALVIAIDIAILFVSAFVIPQIGSVSALAFIVAMTLLAISLSLFVAETRTAARRNRERMREESRTTED